VRLIGRRRTRGRRGLLLLEMIVGKLGGEEKARTRTGDNLLDLRKATGWRPVVIRLVLLEWHASIQRDDIGGRFLKAGLLSGERYQLEASHLVD